ncbi:histidine phosphatase family protein [Robertmurraya sp. P23]|uniref:histidine phosphatase family protein n=1 Tax=Robertmurraya sp. P23 TaxID=3436931 RepID=UPI003D96A7F5
MKKIYVIRHCEAKGQPSGSSLTDKGFEQAKYLVDFFRHTKIDRMIVSPFLRAVQSVQPLSEEREIKIEMDERLSERILSTKDLPDWYEKLRETFNNLDVKFEGGESSQEAMNRIVSVAEEVNESENTIIVSHGNIITLLLKYYHNEFGFEDWKNLSNPDVFQINWTENGVEIKRVWKEDKPSN